MDERENSQYRETGKDESDLPDLGDHYNSINDRRLVLRVGEGLVEWQNPVTRKSYFCKLSTFEKWKRS